MAVLVVAWPTMGCEFLGSIEERAVAAIADGTGGSAQGGGGTSASLVWSDSKISFCTDGSELVEPCRTEVETGHGQDGNYHLNVPDHVVDGDAMRDTVTELRCQSASSNDSVAWDTAKLRCDLEAPTGSWRLPTRLELASLLDLGNGARLLRAGRRRTLDRDARTPSKTPRHPRLRLAAAERQGAPHPDPRRLERGSRPRRR